MAGGATDETTAGLLELLKVNSMDFRSGDFVMAVSV